jgi:integrase/recombinase XerD
MTALEEALADYLALRRRLGHKLEDAERHLNRFVSYLDGIGAETVSLQAALGFVLDPDIDPTTSIPVKRLAAVRGFARHLAGVDPATEIPPPGLVSYRGCRRRPYPFSYEEIAVLMRAAAATCRSRVRASMVATMIGLLAATGMRVGEAIRLDEADVSFDDAVITVRATKFNKSRYVPVATSTIDAMAAYATVRGHAPPGATTRFFRSLAGTPVDYTNFGATFRRAIDTAGIGAGSGVRPRIHDLRHRFAVCTLVGWHRDGLDVATLLPRLSTYLGHRDRRYTYRYLSATPELLGHAAALLEADRAVRP